MNPAAQAATEQISRLARGHPGLRLLVLFGSRARGDGTERSDWDLGYLATPGFDGPALLADLVIALGTDRVDLVDLGRAGAQIRFRAAAEGCPLFASEREAFSRFQHEAVTFWCDAEPVIRAGYAHVLSSLRR